MKTFTRHAQRTVSLNYTDERGAMLGVATTLPTLGWTVIVEQPQAEAFAIPLALERQLAVVIGLALLAMSVIGYFWGKKKHKGNVLTTLVAPLIGAGGMIYALSLLFSNLAFAAGYQSGSLMVKYMPHEIFGTLILGLAYAYWVKSKHPAVYDEIGRTVLAEAHER